MDPGAAADVEPGAAADVDPGAAAEVDPGAAAEVDPVAAAEVDPRAAAVVASLRESGLTIATAESLTGGRVCAALTSVPGASQVVVGGVVSYSLELKASVLGVPRDVLEEQGAVAADTALAMAAGVRGVTGALVGVATTGVAGPDPSEGKPVGTVFVAVSVVSSERESREQVWALTLHGSREQIRQETVDRSLDLVLTALTGTADADL